MKENVSLEVRRNNCKLVFDTLENNNGMTLLDLEWYTNLSRPTVTNLVRTLEEVGLITDIEKKDSTGGRAPVVYGVNPNAYYAIGVDFEYPTLRIAICNFTGDIIYHSKEELDLDLSPDTAIHSIIEQIQSVIMQSGIDEKKILGIGLGIPGTLNLKTGVSVRFEKISNWENIELANIIRDEIGIPVYMENDVHLLYRAEHELWKNNNHDILYVAIRSGIGMAVYQRQHLIEGEFGNAGYIGHMVVQADGPKCKCGNHGCLELYASDKAIVDKYKAITKDESADAKIIAQKALENDNVAREILEEAGKYLGIGIGNAVSLFDINHIIVSSCFDNQILLEYAQKSLDCSVNIPQRRNAKLYPSKLKQEQFAYGGCKLVFQRTRQQIFENIQFKKI